MRYGIVDIGDGKFHIRVKMRYRIVDIGDGKFHIQSLQAAVSSWSTVIKSNESAIFDSYSEAKACLNDIIKDNSSNYAVKIYEEIEVD